MKSVSVMHLIVLGSSDDKAKAVLLLYSVIITILLLQFTHNLFMCIFLSVKLNMFTYAKCTFV